MTTRRNLLATAALMAAAAPLTSGLALAVVEISHPVVEGRDLVYNYKLIECPMPKSGGATALFIDWVGVGGGVGPGFHGVGAGARGVGRR
ncbi:twin-arginine translocation signal domain-containing protein [uncultured Thiodictyon sp.]|uniref:twin-arginine translocation signal domain-containing protein n=1 Tax=uncultured Thiodictyon sp. TaxID=1846217 RepID=UPI0025E4F127|nr:twin-arginine translocation signal domain-containing protein [uncultured Thiodictyon sp.]